ncbi:calmodulin-like protein containing EF hand domain [Leishmania infantum JPCM5]|uniref:Calmodulin-like_protein_containing_EF_hand_domain n=2 Tax=Leishmania infantum TaxID=5671 RepID=A0A6L0WIX7_LEIIN|nr:calmodulin-like protein containing EF hand domain [Leishmania infantum JPCM5]CAC9453027.1 calmodulin-like_protein_containing_EF_hand_domain [Leishmania infantum]CAM65834.1 calmodulin-like protein containing EF hand domain [Leishmania infantum JPCM5]SUZ39456.1 calmodulin-like_protein_containing_EF_hand_domain [Leishmania infantum]|eukprot:XP_001463469.1 calmodulin-like protein containing EF hand domain [Leishmania infantum JPCM5]
MFIVQVAADIFGNKLNFELGFPSRPSLQEITRVSESAFSTEIANTRPDNVPQHTFHISKIKVYDEDKSKWVDLLGEGQLTDYCQLYAFQPENPWHKETQKPIPPATKPPTATTALSRSAAVSNTPSGSRAVASTSNALAPYTGGRSEPATLRRSYAAGASSTALVPRSNADASPEEKLRVVFSEFDNKGTRMIDVDDFKQGFHNMGLDFSSATVEDLFERADLNHDHRISYTEFERFARLYPIMADCLYFRSKAFWEEDQMRKEIQSEVEAAHKSEATLDHAQRSLENAEADVADAQSAVKAADDDLRDRTDRMRDLAKDMEEARKGKERVMREKKEREQDLGAIREREKDARKDLQDLARDSDKLDRRAAALVSDADAADDKVRQLQKALEDAKRTADRAHQAAEQAALEADQAKERERDAAMEADAIAREIPKAEDAVRLADRNVVAADQVLRELDSAGKDIGRQADEAASRRDAGEKAVAEAREKVMQKVRELDAARNAVAEKDRAIKQKEAELDEHRRQRELITQHERTLIEQELRLREQRDSLEQRETKLMSEASNYLGNMRINLATRSYSRDPGGY